MAETVKELIDELNKYPPDMKLTFVAHVAYGGESVSIRPGYPGSDSCSAAAIYVREDTTGGETLLQIGSHDDNLIFDY